MPGDELSEEAGGSVAAVPDTGHARTGPRHAAPRKPLLTRLHVPAGKAIAIAAMPSAVLMGMGLTPQLAHAKPLPKSPFKPGPCVSQEDRDEAKEKEERKERERQQKADAAKAAKALREAKEKKERAEQEREELAQREKAEEEQRSGSSGSDSADSGSGESGSTDSGATDSGATLPGSDSGSGDSSQDSEQSSPLDPLGLGDALGDTVSPEEEQQEQEANSGADSTVSDSTTDSGSTDSGATDSGSSDSGSGSGTSESPAKSAGDTVNKVGDGLKDATGAVGRTADDAVKGAGKSKDKLPVAGGANEDANGKKAFPCVEEKKTEGKDEQTSARLPNDPWELRSTKLALHGLNYEGVVNVTTENGGKKQALKFTADSVDIGDLHQIVQGPGGTKYHVQASKGSNSTIRGGKVTMYTERLQGNLYGLIPIVFDPEHPPPLNVPEAVFTDVKVKQAGQFGGNLTVPGLDQSITK